MSGRLVSGVYIDRSKNEYVSDNLSVTRVGTVNTSYVVNSATNPLGVRDYQTQIANDALFAQLELSPAKDWRLVAGGRYDSITYDFKNNLTPDANFGTANEVRSFARFSPKVGATWAFATQASAYANWSHGFTPPEVSELYGKTATPNLKPAVYENREVGLRAALGNGIKLDTALYELKGRDTIVSYSLSQNESENRNAGRTRSRGLEVALGQDVGAWDWRIGASFAEHEYLSYIVGTGANNDFSGKAMKAAPKQIVNAQLGWKLSPVSRLALGVVYLGSYWMDDANTTRYAGHTLLNLTASHQLQGGWELWGQVRNLTDKLYADTASRSSSGNAYSPGAPRSVMVGLTKSFGQR
jgi:outer membrane receptor protein involved in Fe transport